MRKIDFRLLPPLAILYIAVAGMNEDLGLTGSQYNIALTVFFFPYAVFEVPSNIVLKLMRPSYWITILVIAWGTVRPGFFPAATYLLTTWYCRWELQTRLAIFFSAASLAGAFSGLLAFGISHMNGIAGLRLSTVALGLLIPWLLPDSPVLASFLTQNEKDFVITRLEADSGTSRGRVDTQGGSFKWKYLKDALLDWHIYLGVIMFLGQSIATYGFSFSAPTIIFELGYTAQQAQLLTIPIYFAGACSTIVFARLADKRRKRWPFILIPFSIAAVGFIALLSIPHPRLPGLTYSVLFLITSGLYPAVIGCITWVGNNLAPTFKRAIGMALLMTLGNLGGAIGSNIFLAEQSPQYWLGYGFSLGVIMLAILLIFALRYSNRALNRKRDLMNEEDVLSRYTRGLFNLIYASLDHS
ncbi:hypothetical protein LCI18_008156 [Fusarium solani-melongenae]|uniref:Uncharacterized protein n=1 Tax=Fusarium solani subsp. cucurbitae TaxID=2747967 RepID=A0ACD3Z8Q7_FUSSC|nr:hypothetical protein LCI18_008156 [Fusarium solani-melongenae]